MKNLQDRNFDNIADHFANKVYGGLKGEIRLAVLRRDLYAKVTELERKLQRPLRVLDIGAGLAQISIELAQMGHHVTINDISANMLAKAQDNLASRLTDKEREAMSISWIVSPYQDLADKIAVEDGIEDSFDVILCHAMLEWLAEPSEFIELSTVWLAEGGLLSLCFYNPASFTYRNLMMGNFNVLNKPNFQADNKKSLTPNNPVAKEAVFAWLDEANLVIEKISGLRVFYDYTLHRRGGLSRPADIIDMEVKYSDQEPYKWMGRYLHIMATN